MPTRIERPGHGRRIGGLAALGLLAALALLPGCSNQPQIEGESRELIVALATATSMQSTQLLTASAGQIEARHREGELNDRQYEAMAVIVALAKAGDWAQAQERAYNLRDAQEPTAADLQKVTERKLDGHHGIKPTKSGRGKTS